MLPVDFKGSNITLMAGDNKNCVDLPAYLGEGMYVSRWKCSWRERLNVLLTGLVWLVVATHRHPPVAISGERDAHFVHPNAPDQVIVKSDDP